MRYTLVCVIITNASPHYTMVDYQSHCLTRLRGSGQKARAGSQPVGEICAH